MTWYSQSVVKDTPMALEPNPTVYLNELQVNPKHTCKHVPSGVTQRDSFLLHLPLPLFLRPHLHHYFLLSPYSLASPPPFNLVLSTSSLSSRANPTLTLLHLSHTSQNSSLPTLPLHLFAFTLPPFLKPIIPRKHHCTQKKLDVYYVQETNS